MGQSKRSGEETRVDFLEVMPLDSSEKVGMSMLELKELQLSGKARHYCVERNFNEV